MCNYLTGVSVFGRCVCIFGRVYLFGRVYPLWPVHTWLAGVGVVGRGYIFRRMYVFCRGCSQLTGGYIQLAGGIFIWQGCVLVEQECIYMAYTQICWQRRSYLLGLYLFKYPDKCYPSE